MSKIKFITLFYILILITAAILPNGISNYNAYVSFITVIIYALLIKSTMVYVTSLTIGLTICLFSIFTHPLYTFLDWILIFLILGSISIGKTFCLSEKDQKFIQNTFTFICIASIIGILCPSLYRGEEGEMRYAGLFHAINFSACVFSIINIAVWEIEKKHKKRFSILVLMATCFIIYTLATSTRSLLLVLPYWLYQFIVRKKARIIIICIIAIVGFKLPSIVDEITTRLRLEDNESSMATRTVLYMQLLAGIIDNYGIIPHGSYSATDMIIQFTGDTKYSPHNDFLNFIYNWGAIFYIFCIIIVKQLKTYIKINLEFCLIILAMAACSLHNMMFAIYIWIPFTIILIIRRTVTN